jgi:hypothetical protein
MALLWCVEHGVFPAEQHEKMYKEYAKIKSRTKSSSGAAASASSNGGGSARKSTGGGGRAVSVREPVGDAGMSLGGDEGVGSTTL